MPDTTITGLPNATVPLSGTERVAMDQGGTTTVDATTRDIANLADQPLQFDAAEFIPRTTNGCGIASEETSTNRVNRDLLAFDPGAIEYAQKGFAWPATWNTATATFWWKASSGTGSCVWLARMRTYGDGGAEDQSFGTAQLVTDAAGSANTHRVTSATPAITPAGAVGELRHCVLEIYRDPTNGSDDLAVDALLIGVVLTKAS